MTVQEAIERYLIQVRRSKSPNTAQAYSKGLKAFAACLAQDKAEIEVEQVDIQNLSALWLETFLNELQHQAVATEHLYTTAVAGFYRYVAAQEWATVNLSTLDFELSQRRSQGKRLHIFPEKDVEKLLDFMQQLANQTFTGQTERLTALRDAALIFTLADTGLRVSEACGLRRGDINHDRKWAVVIGKGNKQAVVRFSMRALQYIDNYLEARSILDTKQGRQQVLPIFSRHDKRASKRVLAISPRSAENIVSQYVVTALGEQARGTITPHTFRHYFVTRAARQHDILLAQHLARHESINTTSGYTHLTESEIDAAYAAVFDVEESATESGETL